GKPEIEDDNVDAILGERRERFLARLGFESQIALRVQAGAQETPDRRLIVDDKDARGKRPGRHAVCSSGARAVSGMGSAIRNTAPLRSLRLPAAMVPPIASTKPRQMARPNPVPARCRSPACTR